MNKSAYSKAAAKLLKFFGPAAIFALKFCIFVNYH